MTTGIFELILLVLLSGEFNAPLDPLSMVEPAQGLKLLGHTTDAKSIESLITGSAGAKSSPAEVSKELVRAIQNLASGSEDIRASARKTLIAAGSKVKKRLEDVAATDDRRAAQAKMVLRELAVSEKVEAQSRLVAQLLAMRYAAEKGLTDLVPAIQKQRSSTDEFVRITARDALAVLEPGEDSTAPPTKHSTAFLEALPKTTRMILAVTIAGGKGKPMTSDSWDPVFQSVKKMMQGFGAAPPDDIEEKVAQHIVEAARKFGNARIERLVVVNVDRVDNDGGGMAILAQGLYQPQVLARGLEREFGFEVAKTEGFTTVDVEGGRFILLDNRNMLALPPAPASLRFPLEAVLQSYRGGKRALAGQKELAKFVKSLQPRREVRGMAITDEAFLGALWSELEREMPPEALEALKGMQKVYLTATSIEKTKVRVRFEGQFKKDGQAESLTSFLDAQVKNTAKMVEQQLQNFDFPPLRVGLEILNSMKFSAEGRQGVLRVPIDAKKIQSLVLGAATRTRRVGQ